MLRLLKFVVVFLLASPALGAPWWKVGAVYQIYPRSFRDSNADGVGDLPGITSHLDYVKSLGVRAIWISPFYPSPMKDFGYDIRDYEAIDPLFGSLADFAALVSAAHARGLKVILDFVPNHTSEEHPWFRASRSSRKSPKRDWYVWASPGKNGGPPNNWRSWFGGSAWTFDAKTGQYYYHAYLKEQPDLNWRNPEVVRAMLGIMRFWLELGVDGFRIDAVANLMEVPMLRDNPPNPSFHAGDPEYQTVLWRHTRNLPSIHAVLRKMRAVTDRYPERALIGELGLPIPELMNYYGTAAAPEIQLPFNFGLINVSWTAPAVKRLVDTYDAAVPGYGWPNWVLGNHDQRRIASRVGEAQARNAALLLLTLRGTPTLYQGDELGSKDGIISASAARDPFEKNDPGKGNGRDPERTPFAWNAGPGAGFTTGIPWLPLGPDVALRNVAIESGDPHSMLQLYRRLLQVRRESPALTLGRYVPLSAGRSVLAYERRLGGERWLVALNFSGEPQSLALGTRHGTERLSTTGTKISPVAGTLRLAPNEGALIKLEP